MASRPQPGTLRAVPRRPLDGAGGAGHGAGGAGHGAGGARHHALAGHGLASVMMAVGGY